MQRMNQGQSEIIFLSAITCLFLILVHVLEMFFFGEGQLLNEISSITYQLSQFGIAMFAVIVGLYLFRKSGVKKKEKRLGSLEVSKVVLLFVLWSLVYLILTKIVLNVEIFTGWKDSFIHIALGNSFYHLSFISVVLQFLLFLPLLKIVQNKMGWPFLFSICGIVQFFFLSSSLTIGNEFFAQDGLLPKWIFFFVVGGILAHQWENIQSFLKKFNQLGFVLFIGFIGFEILYYLNFGFIYQNKWSLMITVPILVLSLLGIYHSVRKVVLLDIFLKAIGESTVGIYFVYPLTIFIYSCFLPDSVWEKEYFLLVFTLVLGTSVFISKTVRIFLINIDMMKYSVGKTKIMSQQQNLRIN
ncbi:acyltransferase family protein [Guptibacillus hwajinpoensis]|uniref:acyltransferase family protein n=1 Tax=Guptibacillus hwajinpoensis TaxID=208199 RepID=UPI001CFD872F|nr:acyltransferase family protein [Pseudalkalibacillus hwajinpoensis]